VPGCRAICAGEYKLFKAGELCGSGKTAIYVRVHRPHQSRYSGRAQDNTMFRFAPVALAAAVIAAPAFAAPEKYALDSSHGQIAFIYNHPGYATGYGMFLGFAGEMTYNAAEPSTPYVTVSFPVKSMLTGWEARFTHFMSPDFFDATDGKLVSFTSTTVEVTGDKAGKITGDLTLNGVRKSVVLDAVLTTEGPYPLPPFEGKPAIGFNATTTVLRSDFNLGNFAPFIGDDVQTQM
jgi:polyisoprenoid-binding protein YceI